MKNIRTFSLRGELGKAVDENGHPEIVDFELDDENEFFVMPYNIRVEDMPWIFSQLKHTIYVDILPKGNVKGTIWSI